MATRSEIESAIIYALGEEKYRDLVDCRLRTTNAILKIAAGIKMPDGRISPPLPDLYTIITVATATTAAYKTLGATYHRDVFYVANDDDERILPPRGGGYYSFGKFLKQANYKDLSESGDIYMCCVKGTNLYYQGIPSTSENLLVYCYRLPVAMSTDSSVPDGIPSAFALDLPKFAVLADYWGDLIGKDVKQELKYPDKAYSKWKYYTARFYEVMAEMIESIGSHDDEPQYFDSDSEYAEEEYD